MNTGILQADYAEVRDARRLRRITAGLRGCGLVKFTGITDRDAVLEVAERFMSVRAHRDAGPDGITAITDTGAVASGYAAFASSELIPHTDGSSEADPPGLLLLACVRPANEGGATLVADGYSIIKTMTEQHPAALRSLLAPRAACFGTEGGYLGPVCEPAGPDRMRIRLRLDDLPVQGQRSGPACCAES